MIPTNIEKLAENNFINKLKEDLELLKGESYQRHTPRYYDEGEYYNWFHKHIPTSLYFSNCYLNFINSYHESGNNLLHSVTSFIEEFERGSRQ